MFDKHLGWLIDHKLGKRSQFRGFQYSEIFRAMFCICFCGGSCIEDLNTFLMDTLCQRPGTRVPSPDTVLRGISEAATDNITYTSSRGNDYEVNTADALNELLGQRHNPRKIGFQPLLAPTLFSSKSPRHN